MGGGNTAFRNCRRRLPPDPGAPADLEAHIDPNKSRKVFKDFIYESETGLINYQASFKAVLRRFTNGSTTGPTGESLDDKTLTDIIVQLMRPLETDRPFEAFNLVWQYLKWLRESNIEIKTKLFTLIIRSFERCHDPQRYAPTMLDIYKRLPARNSHATAAMIKAHGVAKDAAQCLEYLRQYRRLPKHDSNERFNFVVYQAALDASILYLKNGNTALNRRLEATARWYIHLEAVCQCDEPLTRKKINPRTNPKVSHPELYLGLQNNTSMNNIDL